MKKYLLFFFALLPLLTSAETKKIEIDGLWYILSNSQAVVTSGKNYIGSIHIPEAVTNIGKQAFRYCTHLTTINIPESVTIIGDRAFRNCDSVTVLVLPKSLQDMVDSSFLFNFYFLTFTF